MPPPKKVNREILQRIPALQLILEIRTILASPECAKIDFTIGALGISPGLYKLVADALMHFEPGIKHEKYSGDDLQRFNVKIQVICVEPQAAIVGDTLVAVSGEYDPEHNILQFPFKTVGDNTEFAGTVVHECTHAALDISSKPSNRLDGEAAARVAKAAYQILIAKAKGKSYQASTGIDTVFQRAAEVMLAFPGCYVFPETHKKIMHEVLQEYGYKYGENELGKFPGWGRGLTMWMPVTVVKRR